jgi:hypothetical protein
MQPETTLRNGNQQFKEQADKHLSQHGITPAYIPCILFVPVASGHAVDF